MLIAIGFRATFSLFLFFSFSVTRGTIHSIDDKQELEIAEINVKITKVLRHSTDELSLSNLEEDAQNEVDAGALVAGDVIKMNMPRHCEPQHGPGEFVFMGRKRLGEMTVVCAPTLTEWAEMARSMNSDGTSHCVLKS